ncbi:DUF2637 domain-containing protein [Streptomyces sp. NA02950]|uniref:DUF2637 domain-containing protein n=1 Tax=Streptomyces sp. NA02950 TaxID=2742137 RepID=UPI0015910A47|nr:DUF2637 domain-containing protein [Streptomyces sp. NA02950]QKV93400.1 DUF2637 domain-containing protein [Streptomyces sp. NA02950]
MQLTRTHRILIGVVVAGAVVIAAIGFAGSYAAVRDLAHDKGFGAFANVFPIGIDAGIVVLLALDLLLTWIRIPFPLLRQTAWLLTAATIAFNGAAAWPDPLGVGMHAVIPVLFVVSVEAARHAVGRIADITADRHMESVRIARWLLAPVPTFRLWRRMKLWELRSYDEVIRLEQDRLVYRARLRARYGRAWRRKAPVESLMPLRLARYGVPLADTAPAGLAAAGLEANAVLPSALPAGTGTGTGAGTGTGTEATAGASDAAGPAASDAPRAEIGAPGTPGAPTPPGAAGVPGAPGAGPAAPAPAPAPGPQELPLSLPLPVYQQSGYQQPGYQQPESPEQQQVTVPVGPNRVRQLGGQGVVNGHGVYVPEQREPESYPEYEGVGRPVAELPDDVPRDEVFYGAFRQFLADNGMFPSAFQFGQRLRETYGVTELSNNELGAYVNDFKDRYRTEVAAEQIP